MLPHFRNHFISKTGRLVHGEKDAFNLKLRVQLTLELSDITQDLRKPLHRKILALDRHKH